MRAQTPPLPPNLSLCEQVIFCRYGSIHLSAQASSRRCVTTVDVSLGSRDSLRMRTDIEGRERVSI